ncbi:MAG: RNA polymerase sigma factor [Bacteroidota bacterium]|nr:RNA polymerase sigma factor [Bacteroidota bacterium]
MKELKEIIRDCQKGKRSAQTALYRMLAPKMFAVCLRYSKDKSEAEDNLQEGFIRVFSKINDFAFKGSFEGWVRKIMVNISLEKYRKQMILQPVEDVRILENKWVEDEAVEKISEDELIAIIQELPPRYRMVFNLYAIEGYSHKEVADELGINEGTSKSNLARARLILKEKIENYMRIREANNQFSA